jgi:endonuclease/exonuclease/phosphatase family metal-dependent hydrolase
LTEVNQISTGRLRIVTLNMAHGRGLSTYQGFHSAKGIERNLNRIVALLRRIGADVVALQEVDSDSHWNKHIHLLEYLQENAGYAYGEIGINNRREGRLPLAYGNGLLSQYAVQHSDNTPFGQSSLGEKGFLYTELALPWGVLPLVNLHLDYRSRTRRIEQIERLIDYLEARHLATGGGSYFSPIICGDFNSPSGRSNDAVNHLFNYLMQHCHYELHPFAGRTFPSLLPARGLDFICVPATYRVRRCKILRSYVSDHRPVLVDLEFPLGAQT